MVECCLVVWCGMLLMCECVMDVMFYCVGGDVLV